MFEVICSRTEFDVAAKELDCGQDFIVLGFGWQRKTLKKEGRENTVPGYHKSCGSVLPGRKGISVEEDLYLMSSEVSV